MNYARIKHKYISQEFNGSEIRAQSCVGWGGMRQKHVTRSARFLQPNKEIITDGSQQCARVWSIQVNLIVC